MLSPTKIATSTLAIRKTTNTPKTRSDISGINNLAILYSLNSSNLYFSCNNYTMDSWLRHIGRGMADTGKIIHDSLDGFGQNAGNALDAWGKEMDKDLDPSHPISIAMTKTGEVAFFTGRETLRCLDGFGKQTEKTVSEAYIHVCQRLSQVDWDNLPHSVREWAENSGKEVGIAVSQSLLLLRISFALPSPQYPRLFSGLRSTLARLPFSSSLELSSLLLS